MSIDCDNPRSAPACFPFFLAQTHKSVGEWLSLVEHLVRDQGVGGSNPLSPTNPFKQFYCSIREHRWHVHMFVHTDSERLSCVLIKI
jgi:hypothetical protein